MMQLVLGAQGLVVFFGAAKLLDNATGIGFLAAIVFGGLPALGLMGALLVMFPRSMLAAGTAFWLATGYGLGTSFGAGGATMAAILVVFGAAGFAANFTLAAQGFAIERDREPTTPADAAWRSPTRQHLAQSGYDLAELARGVARLFDHRILQPATYGRVSSLLPPHGKVARVDPDSEEGSDQLFRDLSDLTDLMLLSPDEEAEAISSLTALTAAGEDRRLHAVRAAEAGRTDTDPAAAPRRPSPQHSFLAPEARLARQSNLLADLFRCRALSPDGFAQAMLRLDPHYDVRQARLENFPPQPAEPFLADIAQSLYQDGILTLADLQGALDVLRPQKSA